MMANISFHSNSSVVGSGGPTKLLSNHHHYHHLFDNNSSPATTTTLSLSTTSSGSSASTISSGATIVTSAAGKLIATVPAGSSVVRAISLADASKFMAKRINGQTLTLTTTANANNSGGSGVITLSHMKTATGNLTTNTSSAPSAGNNVLIYNIKSADCGEPGSKTGQTVLLTTSDAASLLTNGQLNSSVSTNHTSGSGSLKLIAANSSNTSGDDLSKPIIIYPKCLNSATSSPNVSSKPTIQQQTPTILNVATVNGAGGHVLKNTSGAMSLLSSNNGSTNNVIKKIKLELPNVKAKEEITNITPLMLTNKTTTKIKVAPPAVEAVMPSKIQMIDAKTSILTLAQPSKQQQPDSKPISKSNIENCLPGINTQQALMNTINSVLNNQNNSSMLNVQRLSTSSLINSTLNNRHNKYYSLSNISPSLPDDIFDTDDEDEDDSKEDLKDDSIRLSSTSVSTSVPTVATNINEDHSMYAKIGTTDTTLANITNSSNANVIIKKEIEEDEVEMGSLLMGGSFDSVMIKPEEEGTSVMQVNLIAPTNSGILKNPMTSSVVSTLQAKINPLSTVQVNVTNGTISSSTPKGGRARTTAMVTSNSVLKQGGMHSSTPKVTNFTTLVTPKASGGTKFTVLRATTTTAAASKLIATSSMQPKQMTVTTASGTTTTTPVTDRLTMLRAKRKEIWTRLLKELAPRKDRMTAARNEALERRKFLATNCEIFVLNKGFQQQQNQRKQQKNLNGSVCTNRSPKMVMIRKRPKRAAVALNPSSGNQGGPTAPKRVALNSSMTTSSTSNAVSVNPPSVTAVSANLTTSLVHQGNTPTATATTTATTTTGRTITLHITPNQLTNLPPTFLLARSSSTGGVNSHQPHHSATTTTAQLINSGTLKLSGGAGKMFTISSPAILTKNRAAVLTAPITTSTAIANTNASSTPGSVARRVVSKSAKSTTQLQLAQQMVL